MKSWWRDPPFGWHPEMRITKGAMVAFYVVLAGGLGLVLGHINIPRYWRMLNNGEATRGTVLRTDCHNHGFVSYRFTASARDYTGSGSAGFGIPDCHELKPGDQIIVYYLPSNPDISSPGEIRDRWHNELISISLAVIFIPAVAVVSIWRQLPVRHRASTGAPG
jgi:hypothetical protein